ncbi:hypothetical protein GCM10007291_28730 [Gemmobacter nanjingensis]|uniref:Uncharacterized protein n=1 Tax=Gemmobacter nanjingensis TaxID=488454 RepID=A0ABQ3FJT8_9RHOB|nr:hypothetical protein [Gemmobacter nanjingensis]GHC27089.1 hypothetical protein GCM10007291_28730 [Gemmobacter nanjingensis]
MLLHALVANANKDGEVSYYDDALKEGLSKAHWNGNFVESKLWELNESDVIAFEMYGEEGFRPLVVLNIKPATYVRLGELIQKLEADRSNLEHRISKYLHLTLMSWGGSCGNLRQKSQKLKRRFRGMIY